MEEKQNKGMVIKTIVDASLKNYDDRVFEGGREYQKKLDVISAVKAFYKLKVKDEDIYDLLNVYFEIDSRMEASKYMLDVKADSQFYALSDYFESLGKSYSEFSDFENKHQVRDRLREDQNLLDLSPKELMKALEND